MAAPSLSQIRVSQMLVVAPTAYGAVVVFSNEGAVVEGCLHRGDEDGAGSGSDSTLQWFWLAFSMVVAASTTTTVVLPWVLPVLHGARYLQRFSSMLA